MLDADMRPDEFRRAGYEVMDWMAQYLESLREMPVLPRVQPGQLTASLPAQGPVEGEPIDRILADFRDLIIPANTHWNHPRFHAYFSVSAAGPGILAEALTAALNVNGMVWKSSPACVELELKMASWIRQWLELPETFFGTILDTASTSTMHALVAAREFVDPESHRRGLLGDLTVYTSEQAHSSVEKGAIAAGLGQDNVRKIPVDNEFRMIPGELARALEADRNSGKRPCCVIPTVGTTSTTSIDPVRELIRVVEPHGAWVHVDGAYGGCAGIVPELRHILDGVELAHSFVLNPHKWFFTPIDCSLLYTSRPDLLRRAFSLTPEYLRTTEDEAAVNLMDYGVPLGRRFRALKLWFVLRYFGRDRMATILRGHCEFARELARRVEADERFELCAPVPLSLVCFRLRGTDGDNRRLLEGINASGEAFLSHTVLKGQVVLRCAFGNLRTTWQDVDVTWRCILTEADRVLSGA